MKQTLIQRIETGWEPEFWLELYQKAEQKGDIVQATLGPHEFEYALLTTAHQYGGLRHDSQGERYQFNGSIVSFWIKDHAQETPGFNICGKTFVFERALPRPDFADFVGLHQHVETSHRSHAHALACRVELGEVLKQDEEFVAAYAQMICDQENKCSNPGSLYFGRAIKGFEDVFQNGLHLFDEEKRKLYRHQGTPVELLTEFKRQLDDGWYLL